MYVSYTHYALLDGRVLIVEKLSLITKYWNHFINTYSSNETCLCYCKTVWRLNVCTSSSTNTSTVVWATAYIQQATLLWISYLSLGMHRNIERGTVLKQTTKIKSERFIFMKMKIYISIKAFGNFILIHLYALYVSVSA